MVPDGPLSPELLARMDAYWRAANYLTVGQIYLKANPLLREPLKREHVKPRLLGHFGTTTGLNFLYAHLNRLIVDKDLDMIFVAGPGHGGPGLVAQSWLEGTWTEHYPDTPRDAAGMETLMREFSWPYGVPSHVAPVVPGSIHEGGELGYSLVHAFGAAFDNPDLIVACVVGDGEAETGTLAASWHSNKWLNPARDGAVLPILHLNGWKIANPTILARLPDEELKSLFVGYGWEPILAQGDEPEVVHQALAAALDEALAHIRAIQAKARAGEAAEALRPRWPMIVFATPKGWSAPKVVDGKPVEGTWRAHQVPLDHMDEPGHLEILESWLKSYGPEALFDANGAPVESLKSLPPKGERRMSANPHANGGLLLRDLDLPDWRGFAVEAPAPGAVKGEATRTLGRFLCAVMERNLDRFRVMGPDETASNRLDALYAATKKAWLGQHSGLDLDLSPDGRVLEVLSENLCEGWLEGYLLTGRHGFFSCYEAFIHIVDSMFNQHAKWLEACNAIPWRAPIASLNILLSSHVWQQDHNGFSHQDPGFIDHVANKRAGVVRIYLPPDANTLLSTVDHMLRSRNYVNVAVCGKAPEWQWLDAEAAAAHCAAGAARWDWASAAGEPDVILACGGDVPTLETLAAVTLLRERAPDLKTSVVNVVDLFRLGPFGDHPHALSHEAFDTLFPPGKPVIFAFHGYPGIVHKLTYNRAGHDGFHVHGYREEGSTTTPFDMTVRNGLDRYTLAADAIRRARPDRADAAVRWRDELHGRHKAYVIENGEDMPEVRDWRWSPAA